MLIPFLANGLILYNLKIPEIFGFWCFQGGIKWERWLLAVFNISFKLTHLSPIFSTLHPLKTQEKHSK